ncbi:MAG: NAD-dependent epimerase/dehydratase family protein, partial [Planctomycetota bacterium]
GFRFTLPESLLSLVAHVGELAGQLTGRPPLLSRQRLREMEGRAYLCTARALERDAAWRARVPAAEGTARTAAWYREHGWL